MGLGLGIHEQDLPTDDAGFWVAPEGCERLGEPVRIGNGIIIQEQEDIAASIGNAGIAREG